MVQCIILKCPNLLGDRRAGFGVAGGEGHGTDAQHETWPSTQTTPYHQLAKAKVNKRKVTP